MALAERMLAARFNQPGHEIVDHHTYVIASDGDLQEGVASEASSLAGHLGLGKLIGFYDDNHISIEGDTALSLHRGRRRALRGLRLARPEPRRGHRRSTASSRRWPTPARVDGQAEPDHRPHPHRARLAEQAGHRTARTARRSATRRSGSPRRSTAGRARSRSSSPRRRSTHFRECDPARRGARGRVARALRGLPRPSIPSEAAEFERILVAASCPTAGTPTCPRRARTRA